MATDYGISTEGFRKKRLADIKLEIENELKSLLGNNINLLPTSVFSQLIGVYSERESSIWELAELVYNSQYPNSADGVNLDNVMTLLGVTRLPQTKTLQKSVHLLGDAGTVIPAATKFSVFGSPTSVFETQSAVTLVAGLDEVQTLTSSVVPSSGSFRLKYQNQETGILNFNVTAAQIQTALQSLSKLPGVLVTGDFTAGFVITFAGLSGKIDHEMLVATSVTLNSTLTITETTKGVPQGTVDARCVLFGPVVSPAFTLTNIDTPVVGLNSVTNPTDGVVGRLTETDNALRQRATVGQQSRGSTTVPAIRARLLEVSGVTQAVVFQNETFTLDANGLEGKSFRAYVQGGANQDILQCIWDNKPAGIKAGGAISGIVIDTQGLSQVVAFERPIVRQIYVNARITRDLTKFPSNGADLVRSAIELYVNSLEIGQSLIVYPGLISSLRLIVGVLDVELGVGFLPAPMIGSDANLTIEINEIGKVLIPATDIGVTLV